ncbi:hypothetical protein ACJMK2_019780 [Sinanodonta woodiana]|uniref:Uncharacterized protein n=1 Tax=Sinanodonta woodiana TaxID=1069815 RepID=A0ABD3TYQ5_SINWO
MKENVFLIVNNTLNERMKICKWREFGGNCGTWGKGTSPTNYFVTANKKLVSVIKRDGQYCT